MIDLLISSEPLSTSTKAANASETEFYDKLAIKAAMFLQTWKLRTLGRLFRGLF